MPAQTMLTLAESGRDILLMLMGLAQRVESADEDGAYVAFVNLLGKIKPCDAGMRVRAQFVAQALLRNIDYALGLRDAAPASHRGTIHDPRLVSLSARLPPMMPAALSAQAVLADMMAERREATLIEIGAGSGQRVRDLLRVLSRHDALPRKLTVVAVTSSGSDLAASAYGIAKLAGELGLRLRFEPVQSRVEDMTPEQWEQVPTGRAGVFIRAAFALHHIGRDQSGTSRKDEVLRRFRSLNPEALVIAEPSSSFETDDILHRLAHGWRFYGSCFDILDRMPVSLADRALARMFYAQEMVDALSLPPTHRTELFETSCQWLGRLRRAGFNPHPGLRQAYGRLPRRRVKSGLVTALRDGHIAFDHGGQPLAAVICVH